MNTPVLKGKTKEDVEVNAQVWARNLEAISMVIAPAIAMAEKNLGVTFGPEDKRAMLISAMIEGSRTRVAALPTDMHKAFKRINNLGRQLGIADKKQLLLILNKKGEEFSPPVKWERMEDIPLVAVRAFIENMEKALERNTT